MTLRHVRTITAPETPALSIDSGDRTESKIFEDNIEHLEALEYSARLKLAIAYLRRGKAPAQSDRHGGSLFDQAREKCVLGPPDFGFSDLSSDGLAIDELEALLEKVERETGRRVQNSIKHGIELYFERLCESYELDLFERAVVGLLLANNTSKSFMELYAECQCQFDPRDRQDGSMRIGTILSLTTPSLRDQIAGRKYFSVEARLIKHEIIIPWLSYDSTTNILDMVVHLHERIVRYVLGDNNTYDTDMQCISRQRSTVELDQVILPGTLKEEVYELAKNYSNSRSRKERGLIDKFYGYGTGLTLLLHGPSGTGKTMLAHALANSLDKELLSLNMEKASRTAASLEDLIKSVFKEARLCTGIVFFDECDDAFQAGSFESRTLLIEIEKADCITILATNRVVELDPSLDRRISMKVPFKLPDKTERENIWKVLAPPGVLLSKEIDFKELAGKYIFTGGLIKNAVFMAVTNALTKNGGSKATLTAQEVEKAANYQATSMFELNRFGMLYAPELSIDELCIRSHDKRILRKLASVYAGLAGQDTGMALAVGSSDIHTGMNCVDAVAKECQLKVKSFCLSDLFCKEGSSNHIRDPLTQEELTPMECAFRTSIGHKCLTVFIDHCSSFQRLISKERKDWTDEIAHFFYMLREFQGLFFLVTTPFKEDALPIEFDQYIEIHFPPEELQIRQWERHFKNNAGVEAKIIDLVERYPMHLHEIGFIAHKAHVCAVLNGNETTITIDSVYDTINRFKNVRKAPVLFGKKI